MVTVNMATIQWQDVMTCLESLPRFERPTTTMDVSLSALATS